MDWLDLVDVGLVAILVTGALVWLRRSGARWALLGVAIVGAVMLLAARLDLELTAWLLQGVATVFLVLIVVLFQDDLRRVFEQIGRLGARRRRVLPPSAEEILIRCVRQMAAQRTGALIVIPGVEGTSRFLDGGVALDGWVSEPLLLSLFDPRTPGHDGAVVLQGNRVLRFGAHLPLSSDHAQLVGRGTRHAAALGLAERTDAFCVVVSEERGSVSVARDGVLRTLVRPDDLAAEIAPFLERVAPRRAQRWSAMRDRWPEAAAGLAISLTLWLLLVPGSRVVEVEREAPVRVENLPDGYRLESVDPDSVEVLLSGERRRLVLEGLAVEVHVDAFLARLGRRTFQVSAEDVSHPEGIDVLEVSPRTIRISVQKPEASP